MVFPCPRISDAAMITPFDYDAVFLEVKPLKPIDKLYSFKKCLKLITRILIHGRGGMLASCLLG